MFIFFANAFLSNPSLFLVFVLNKNTASGICSLFSVVTLLVSDRITRREAFTATGAFLDLGLEFSAMPLPTPTKSFELYQNIPNPFSSETVIGFHLPEAGEVTLTVQDVAGRTLYTTQGTFSEGYNQIRMSGLRPVQSNPDAASGIWYYTLSSGSFTATKSMIYIGH